MAKDKGQKKKDREKRVAKEKNEAATKRRQQEQPAADGAKKVAKTFGVPHGTASIKPQGNLPKTGKQFTQRRSGGA